MSESKEWSIEEALDGWSPEVKGEEEWSDRKILGNWGREAMCVKNDRLQLIRMVEQCVALRLRPVLEYAKIGCEGDCSPLLLNSHYRGMQVLSEKKTAIISSLKMSDEYSEINQISALHEIILRFYERLQNNSRYTLNALITSSVETQNLDEFTLLSKLTDGVTSISVNNRTVGNKRIKKVTAHLGRDITSLLLGEDYNDPLGVMLTTILEPAYKDILHATIYEIQKLWFLQDIFINRQKDSSPGRHEPEIKNNHWKEIRNIDSQIESLVNELFSMVGFCEEIERVKRNLDHYLMSCSFYSATLLVNDGGLGQSLKALFDIFSSCLEESAQEQAASESSLRQDQLFPLLRMLQGMVSYHRFYSKLAGGVDTYLHSTAVTCHDDEWRDKPIVGSLLSICANRYSGGCGGDVCKGWGRIYDCFYENDHSLLREAFDKLRSTDPRKTITPEEQKDISSIFRPDEVGNIIKQSIGGTNISLRHLCSVVALAELLRPQAVHEGESLEIAFLIGTPYHRKRFTSEVSSSFTSSGEYWPTKPPMIGVALLELLPNIKADAENLWKNYTGGAGEDPPSAISKDIDAYRNLTAARIKGRHAECCAPRMLFVDYTRPCPGVSHIVTQVEARGLASRTSLRAFTQGVDKEDMCIVRVYGKRRIELLHDGNIILAWDDEAAKWRKPQQWNKKRLKKAILKHAEFPSTSHEHIERICDIAVKISDEAGHGATFLFSQVSPAGLSVNMVEKIGEPPSDQEKLDMLDDQYIQRKAIQDGGTAIYLVDNEAHIRFHQRFSPAGSPVNDKSKIYSGFDPVSFEIPGKGVLHELWRKDGEFKWGSWPSVLHWGTRHLSALGMTACLYSPTNPKAVCVCISEDGPINVMCNGTVLSADDYKQV